MSNPHGTGPIATIFRWSHPDALGHVAAKWPSDLPVMVVAAPEVTRAIGVTPGARAAQPARADRDGTRADDREGRQHGALAEIVRMRGHSVTVVHHPMRALEIVDALGPEVALLDLGLPDMDGYQLAAQLRERVPECRRIALTGYGQHTDRARTAAAGFTAHLVKPVKIAVLLELLAK